MHCSLLYLTRFGMKSSSVRPQAAELSCVLMQDRLCCVVRTAAFCLIAHLSDLVLASFVFLGVVSDQIWCFTKC